MLKILYARKNTIFTANISQRSLFNFRRMQDVESSPPGTVMDFASPRNDAGSSNTSMKSPTPSQKAREWEKRINQSMGGNISFQMYHIVLFQTIIRI